MLLNSYSIQDSNGPIYKKAIITRTIFPSITKHISLCALTGNLSVRLTEFAVIKSNLDE